MAFKTDLMAWWSLDEESGARADSHGSNNLADNGTVLFNTGKQSNAAQFVAAQEEWLSINDNADLSAGDVDFTIAAWLYLDSEPGNMRVVSKWAPTNQSEYLIEYNSVPDRFQVLMSSNGVSAGSTTLTANNLGAVAVETWYYIIIWHDATANTINIQGNNGTPDSDAHAGGVFDGTAPFYLGQFEGVSFWDGRIDEVGFWKRKLTASERTWLYNGGAGRAYSDLDAFIPTAATIF